jgi:tRNA A58 N-methylase Trm61
LKSGESVLEIGCGTGRLLADLAGVVGPSGQAYGLEPEPHFAKEAEQYLAGKKLQAKVRIFT